MDAGKELAVQSYCFRGFKSNEEVADKVLECGLRKLELCAVHADFTDESGFDAVIDTYRKRGVEIVSIGVQGFKNDPATERKYFEFVKRAGVRVMSANFTADSVPDSVRSAEALAGEYDVRLGIHNHGGRHWLGSSQALTMVFGWAGARVGLMLDTAWALDSGEDPVKMAEAFGDRLVGVHIKDFVFDRARKPEDVVVGTGNLDLPGLLATMKKVGCTGPAILEYEGDVENPVPALKQCVEAVASA
jgi:sugar phosphate isomerase/epimerase